MTFELFFCFFLINIKFISREISNVTNWFLGVKESLLRKNKIIICICIRIVSMRSGYVCCSIYTRPAAVHVAIAPPHLTLLFLYALYFVFCCVHTQQQRWEKRAGCYIQKGNPISMLLFLIPSSLRPRFFRIYYILVLCTC